MATHNRELGSQYPELSRREVIKKSDEVVDEYPRRAISVLHQMVKKGHGKEVLASVFGRPEDEQLGIDAHGEHILTGILNDRLLPSIVLGEHNKYDTSVDGNPQVIFALDSFDNTSQYKRGLDTTPYSVLSAYHLDGRPIATSVADLKESKFYIAQSVGLAGQRTGVIDLEINESNAIHKSKRTNVEDHEFTLATYLGSNEYSMEFIRYFRPLLADMAPKGLLYAGGGAYIYGLLASGAVDAYVMFNEPRSEIDPGFPIALAAGCTIVEVDRETGVDKPYKFDAEKNKQTVPFFIAAANEEVKDRIIKYYAKGKENLAEEEEVRRVISMLRAGTGGVYS